MRFAGEDGSAEGPGGLGALNAFLDGEKAKAKVLFGGFRVNAIDERTNVVSTRCKLLLVTFFGAGAKARVRSNAGMQRGNIAETCGGFHASLHWSADEMLTEAAVAETLLRAGGSHKPSRFEFLGDAFH